MPSPPEKGLITKRAVDACTKDVRQYVFWDTGDGSTKGFGLLVLPSGTKSYVYQYRIGGRGGRLRRFTIGRHGGRCTPDQARNEAESLAEQVRRGIDPIDAERRDAEETAAKAKVAEEQQRLSRELALATYAETFLKLGVKPATRQRTREGYAATLRNHIVAVLGDKPLPEIGRRDLVRVLDRIPIGQPAVRRITFAVLRMLFKWAKGRGDIEVNPLDGMDPPPNVTSRDRVLSDAELALAIRAAGAMDAPFGPLYLLLFATGQRREEVAGLDWAELDRKSATWTLPRERSKNGEASLVPLNRHAMAVLDQMAGQSAAGRPLWPRTGLLFTTTGHSKVSGYSRTKARLDAVMLELARKDAKEAGADPEAVTLAPWRLHDARRTLATGLQRLGVRFEVTEAVLNHTAGASRSGVAAVYQRHDWGPEKRAALEAWADHCDRVVHPVDDAGNVVELRPSMNP